VCGHYTQLVLDEQSAGIERAWLAGILEDLPDGVVIADGDGRIVYANQQAAELSGYASTDLRELRVEDLLPLQLRAIHEGHRHGYLEAPRPRRMGSGLGLWLRRRDGSQLAVDIALSPITSSQGTLVIASIRDDTPHREAAWTLREQGHLLEAAHDAFIARCFGDGTITFWNQGAVHTYGYSRREALGAVSHQLLATTFPEGPRSIERTLTSQGQWEGELVHVTRDRREIVVESRQVLLRDGENRPVTIFEVNRDVTEARQDRDRTAGALEISTAVTAGEQPAAVAARIVDRARLLLRGQHALLVMPGAGAALTLMTPDRPTRGLLEAVLARPELSGTAEEAQALILDHVSLRWDGQEVAGPAVSTALEGHPNGLLLVMGSPGRLFGARDAEALRSFAVVVGGALERARLREELRRLALVQDRERIARNLHDTVIKSLFGVALRLQGTATRSADAELRSQLEAGIADIDRAIAELRAYVFGLRSDHSPGG
jgi:PAS domain S-box-containing protein